MMRALNMTCALQTRPERSDNQSSMLCRT